MAIRYRYPNEDWIEVDADTYELDNTENYCQNLTDFWVITQATTYYSCDTRTGFRSYSRERVSEAISLYGWRLQIPLDPIKDYKDITLEISPRYFSGVDVYSGLYYPVFVSSSGQKYLPYNGTARRNYISQSPSHPGCSGGQSKNGFDDVYSAQIISVSPYYQQDIICGACTVRFYKNQELVKTASKEGVCPEIEEVERDRCPEGTCEVICGDTICCYGSDGIAATSFPRT